MENDNLLPDDEFKIKNRLRMIIIIPVIIILLALLVTFIALYAKEKNKTNSTDGKKEDGDGSSYYNAKILPSWKNCSAK